MAPALPIGVPRRLSEKTIELNLAREAEAWIAGGFWFGLTQEQEAMSGYDAAVSRGSGIVYFQFKVSNVVRRGGARQFRVSHAQLEALRGLAQPPRTVFYVLPDFGNVDDLAATSWVMWRRTYFLDLADITTLSVPTTSRKELRRSGLHYVDLYARGGAPHVLIHSEPSRADLLLGDALFAEDLRIRASQSVPPDLRTFIATRRVIGRNSLGLVLPRPQT